MKKFLSSLIFLGVIATVIFGVTTAFFSDTETSKDNILQAGSIDLKIDNESYYNGVLQNGANGTANTSWELVDLDDKLFFNFRDLKPGDLGEDTISLHAENDYWACMEIETTENDDETCTEPENLDDIQCEEPDNPEDKTDGELAELLNFIFWNDDGDNIFEEGERILDEGLSTNYFDGKLLTLADSTLNLFEDGGPLHGTKTYYIGKAWCFGTLTKAPRPQDGQGANSPYSPADPLGGGVLCDGKALNNATQTDLVLMDIGFSAVQSRHNPDFRCDGQTPSVPNPIACNQADVMLVLDRSGSISATELGQLKTAATDFVTALGLSTTGIHAGQSSFATLATLDQHLTDSSAAMNAAIAALVSGGFTNLKGGIDLASGEFANPGDGHDRADVTSPDKMIVITDGRPNRPLDGDPPPDVDAANAADAARASGVEIFVVGVGSDVDATYLTNEIANAGAGHYFSVSDYAALQTALQNLDLCQ